MVRLGINFVPILYRRPGKVGFLALLAGRKINNLRGINTPLEFDSVPGYHFYSFREQRLFVTSREARLQLQNIQATSVYSKGRIAARTWHSLAHGTQANHVHFVGMGSLNR